MSKRIETSSTQLVPEIIIYGNGYVGRAMTRMLKDHYIVAVKDIGKEFYIYHKDIIQTVEELYDIPKLGIICVPTPMSEDKGCDTSIVESVLENMIATPVVLIKSTVAPGFTDWAKETYGKRIVFSPEYAGESNYWSPYTFDKDMRACPFVILGGDKQDTRYVLDILVPVLGPTKTYYQVTAKEAEVIKYMENTYFGVKITFANEMKNICDALGVDYYAVRTGWALDPRVDPMHTMVFPNAPGFGGKCLPKDINAIVKAAEEAGYDAKFIKEVLNSNDRFRAETH